MKRIGDRVLLIGWDGADWKMIDPLLEKGQMPNLQKLLDGGVMGNVASLTPMLSPILWTSIATGKHADKHGILGFAEPDGISGERRPVASSSRKCKALWNILSQQGKKACVLNWYASHPAEAIDGVVVTDRFAKAMGPPDKEWPPVEHSVSPASLLDEACKLRVHPAATTPMQVAPFIPRLGELDPQKDANLHQLRILLAECATTHAAATWLMADQRWDCLAVYYDAIDRFAHTFMEYHPPRMPHVSEKEFELYKDVMTGIYCFHDMMLGRMMQLADERTTFIILSDHGFHCDHLRPEGSAKIKDGRPVAWHRQYGIFVISGPEIKKDERVYGASLLDITPTVLWLLDCPVAKDMDGKPLTQTATDPAAAKVEEIDTYEAAGEEQGGAIADPQDSSPTPQAPSDDPWVAQQMIQRLADLGYVEQNASVEGVVLDRARNLGQVYAATGRPKLAIAEYEKVLACKPDDKGCRMAIASCRLELGELEECEAIVRGVLGVPDTDDGATRDSNSSSPESQASSPPECDAPQASLYLGMISFRRGDTDAALKHLKQAEKAEPRMPGLHVQIGNVYLRRQRWQDAERAFKKALDIDPDSAEARDGLGVAYRWQKRPAEAVHEHMQSIALLHYRPQTHIHLGLALAETGQIDWAIRAFNVALEQNPKNPFPHHCLAQLYERAKQDPGKAEAHRQMAAELRPAVHAGGDGDSKDPNG